MSNLDSEYEDDHRARGTGGGTPPRHRPAWDAATYGRPDDTPYSYQRPPARGRPVTGGHRYGDGMSADPLYSDDGHAPQTNDGDYDTYPADSPQPGPDRARRYPPERFHPGSDPPPPYPTEPYPPEPYSSEPHRAAPYTAAPYPARPYQADTARTAPYSAEPRRPRPSSAVAYSVASDQDGRAMGGSEPRKSRAGRDLPAAIGVGVLLGAGVLASLFLWRPAFLAVVVLAVGAGTWELVRALRSTGANPPLLPLIGGGVLMSGLAWWGHADALTFGLIVTVLAVMVWRFADSADGYARDVSSATLVAVYLPFLAGFAAILASPTDGEFRVLVTLAGVVLSDTGGYVAGVLFGKHPMAPSVSPKKSWEGLVGSLLATGAGGAAMLYFLFDVTAWMGALFGMAVSAAAVLGDLGESLIKRDMGVKDMSRLLPGHGGIMDRLDSILFAAPTAYALLIVLAPPP